MWKKVSSSKKVNTTSQKWTKRDETMTMNTRPRSYANVNIYRKGKLQNVFSFNSRAEAEKFGSKYRKSHQ